MGGKSLAAAVCLTLLATACGSTAQVSSRLVGADGLQAQGQGPEPGPAVEGGGGPAYRANGPDKVTGGRDATAASPHPRRTGVPLPTTDARIGVPGVTDREVFVGAWYAKNTQAANAALGAGAVDQGDAREYWNAVIADVNARGGIAGRKVVPLYYGLDATSTQTIETQMSAACSYWTQDHKVLAILNADGDATWQCAQRAGAVSLGTGTTAAVPSTFRTYPHAFEPSTMNLVRAGASTVDGLVRQGYFSPSAKVAVVAYDDAAYRTAVKDGWDAALARHGVKVAAHAYLTVAHSAGEVGQTSADARAAVLKLAAQGIDHVLLVDGVAGAGSGLLTLEFVLNAEAQHFRPRYGVNSYNALSVIVPSVPKGAFERALGVGWLPTADLFAADDPEAKASPARRRCMGLMAARGITFDNRAAQDTALGACDSVWYLVEGVREGRLASRDTVTSGLVAAGEGHASPLTSRSWVTAARHDGVVQARHLAYVSSCSCFRYASAPYDTA